MTNWDFKYTDDQWREISGHLSGIGRLPSEGDRRDLETMAWMFVGSRKHPPRPESPARAKKAWLKVADAAEKLDAAIDGLGAAGAADFTIIDNHQGRAAEWRAALPSLVQTARYWSEIEGLEQKRKSNNTDAARDWFVMAIAEFWRGRGGAVRFSHSDLTGETGGPFIRFLSAATAPVLEAIGKKPLPADTLRNIVRSNRRRAAPW